MERADKPKHLLSINQLTRADIEDFIRQANFFDQHPRGHKRLLDDKIVSLLFFQPSTRTRIGFEAAAYRLGAQVLKLDETKFQDNMTLAESLEDTVRVLNGYCDAMCIRHPDANVFERIDPLVSVPLINACNGDDEHPTQSLIDLMTIQNLHGRLDNLNIALVGDLRFLRTAHSLALGLSKFEDITITAISPEELRLPDQYKNPFISSGNNYHETVEMDLANADVVYVNGFAPKTPIDIFDETIRKRYQINEKVLEGLKAGAIILSPLPRIDEITHEVDQTPNASYFKQSDWGLFMRMAILHHLIRHDKIA